MAPPSGEFDPERGQSVPETSVRDTNLQKTQIQEEVCSQNLSQISSAGVRSFFLLFLFLSALLLPLITAGGGGRIKIRLISSSSSSSPFVPLVEPPAAARLLFHFLQRERGENENGSCLFTRSHDRVPIRPGHSVGRLSSLIRHPSEDEGGGGGAERREKRGKRGGAFVSHDYKRVCF